MIKRKNMVKKSYYYPEELIESLREKSNETGLSMSDLIRMAIKKSLKKG
jgi:hypothetical protein